MDMLSNVRFDPEILKEPRGVMRIVQLVLAIFAFATVTAVRTSTNVIIACGKNGTDEHSIPIHYGYPFRIKKTADIYLPFCSKEQTRETGVIAGNFSSAAEFFCFVGVISFLVCLILIPAYLFLSSFFSKGTLMSKVDFVGSAVWTLIWFIASAAWADNVSKLIAYMDPDNLIRELEDECAGRCRPGLSGDHSTLITSVLFGFLNMGLQGASLWFLFKETDWHKDKGSSDTADHNADFQQPYAEPGYQTPEYTQDPSIPTTPTGNMQSSFGSTGGGTYNSRAGNYSAGTGGYNDYYGSGGQPTY